MTMPNTGYAPWVLEGGEGITITQTGIHVKISATGGGGGFTVAGDGLEGIGNTINLGELEAGARTLRADETAVGVQFQQQDRAIGDGSDLFIGGQTTTDPNGSGGDVIIRAGSGGLQEGSVDIAVTGGGSILLDELGEVTIIGTANGITLEDQSGFGIILDTVGPVQIGTGNAATHAINGADDVAAGAVVDYWVVSFNGNPRKIAMLALA